MRSNGNRRQSTHGNRVPSIRQRQYTNLRRSVIPYRIKDALARGNRLNNGINANREEVRRLTTTRTGIIHGTCRRESRSDNDYNNANSNTRGHAYRTKGGSRRPRVILMTSSRALNFIGRKHFNRPYASSRRNCGRSRIHISRTTGNLNENLSTNRSRHRGSTNEGSQRQSFAKCGNSSHCGRSSRYSLR